MAISEDRADVPSDAASPHPESARPSGRLRTLVLFAILPGLFAAALAGSWLARQAFSDDDPPELASGELPGAPAKKIEQAGNGADVLERGDQALAQHRFTQARGFFVEVLKRQPQESFPVAYRIGLCNEALGQLDDAALAYRGAIGASSTPGQNLAAHLGLARCLLREHYPADVRRLLFPFLTAQPGDKDLPAPLRAGARYLFALAYAEQTHPPAIAGRLVDDSLIPVNAATLEAPFYLDDLGPTAKPAEEKKDAPPLLLKKQPDPLESMVLRVELDEQPVRTLLDRLAAEGGLHPEWSAEASNQVEKRTLRLGLRNWPLIDLLEAAADHFDLICEVTGDKIRFSTTAQTDATLVATARRSAVRRALRGAANSDPAHPWWPAVMLELGVLEAGDGKSAKAVIWFDRLLRAAPASPQSAPASFNLGLLHAQNQEHALARQAWFRVVDYLPGHELALRAYLRIAQSLLEQEDNQEAIVQLRRAQNFAPGSPYRPLMAMLLAAAHLQKGEPDNARQALAKHRAELLRDSHKPMATFLDAYAEYRVARPVNGGRREASDLLNSLWQGLDDNPLGPVGHSLIAAAYLDLGFGEQAEKRLRLALATTKGPYVPPLEFVLGKTLLTQNRRDEAKTLFEKLSTTHSRYQSKALFQLAQIDLQLNQFPACEAKCRQIWGDEAFTDKTALLQLWGTAFDGMGEYGKAAKCFAGKTPD